MPFLHVLRKTLLRVCLYIAVRLHATNGRHSAVRSFLLTPHPRRVRPIIFLTQQNELQNNYNKQPLLSAAIVLYIFSKYDITLLKEAI